MSLVGSLNTGVSALQAFSQGMQVIANNIANVNTTAYKGTRADYSDNFYNLVAPAAPSAGVGVGSNLQSFQLGTGVRLEGVSSDWKQGTLTGTGNSTDLGIAGLGFFRVRDSANNVDYATRAGDFRLDDQGFLVTGEGYRVQGVSDGWATFDATDVNGAISYTKTAIVPAALGDLKVDYEVSIGSGLTNSTGGAFTDAQVEAGKPAMRSFTVDRLGNIIIGLSNGDTFIRGRVLLQNFRDPGALTREGANLFSGFAAAGPDGGVALSEANNSPGTNGLGAIEVGTLELSNVDLAKEFATMITTQRSFQAGSRIVTVSDSLLEEVINLKR